MSGFNVTLSGEGDFDVTTDSAWRVEIVAAQHHILFPATGESEHWITIDGRDYDLTKLAAPE